MTILSAVRQKLEEVTAMKFTWAIGWFPENLELYYLIHSAFITNSTK